MKINEILDNYLVHLELKELKSQKTAQTNVSTLKQHFKGTELTEFKPRDLLEYIKSRRKAGRKNNTIRREIGVLRASMNLAVEYGIIEETNGDGNYSKEYLATKNIQKWVLNHRPSMGKRDQCPTESELEKIFEKLPECVEMIARAAYLTGWRKSELIHLRFEDINFEEKEIYLFDHKTRDKTHTLRVTPMYSDLYNFMKQQRDLAIYKHGDNIEHLHVFREKNGTEIKLENTYVRWRNAVRKAGLVDRNGKYKFNFHDIRRASVRMLFDKLGFDRYMIMDCYTGHSSPHIFEGIYNKKSPETYRNVYKRVAMSI
jgi:integrase